MNRNVVLAHVVVFLLIASVGCVTEPVGGRYDRDYDRGRYDHDPEIRLLVNGNYLVTVRTGVAVTVLRNGRAVDRPGLNRSDRRMAERAVAKYIDGERDKDWGRERDNDRDRDWDRDRDRDRDRGWDRDRDRDRSGDWDRDPHRERAWVRDGPEVRRLENGVFRVTIRPGIVVLVGPNGIAVEAPGLSRIDKRAAERAVERYEGRAF